MTTYKAGDRVRRTQPGAHNDLAYRSIGGELVEVGDEGVLVHLYPSNPRAWRVRYEPTGVESWWEEENFELVPTHGRMTVRADQLQAGDRWGNGRNIPIEAVLVWGGKVLIKWGGATDGTGISVREPAQPVMIDRKDPDPEETVTLRRSQWDALEHYSRTGWEDATHALVKARQA